MSKTGNPIQSPAYVLNPDQNYRGLTYGDLIATWTNWLLSPEVDYSETTDILFLRGNIGFYDDMSKLLDRTGENAEFIYEGTSILVPVICTFLRIGDYYEGGRIETEAGLRNSVFRTVESGGNMWAKIKYVDDPIKGGYDIVPLITSYYMESPLFKLIVSERSKFKDKLEEPFESGIFDAVTGGYFLLIKGLPKGEYRIRFGGKGKGTYLTDSIYDITILGQTQTIRGSWTGLKKSVQARDPPYNI